MRRIAEGIRGGNLVPTSILLTIDSDFAEVDPDPEDEISDEFVVIRPLVADWREVQNPTAGHPPGQLVRFVELDSRSVLRRSITTSDALLVDGQQRTAALSLVPVEDVPAYSLAVNAIVVEGDEAKRIFQIANSTVKISTDFGLALLASMDEVPVHLSTDKRRATATRVLASVDSESPFLGLVKYPGAPSTPSEVVAHNSLYQVVGTFDGPLEEESEDMLIECVRRAYSQVAATWPTAWGKRLGGVETDAWGRATCHGRPSRLAYSKRST